MHFEIRHVGYYNNSALRANIFPSWLKNINICRPTHHEENGLFSAMETVDCVHFKSQILKELYLGMKSIEAKLKFDSTSPQGLPPDRDTSMRGSPLHSYPSSYRSLLLDIPHSARDLERG